MVAVDETAALQTEIAMAAPVGAELRNADGLLLAVREVWRIDASGQILGWLLSDNMPGSVFHADAADFGLAPEDSLPKSATLRLSHGADVTRVGRA